MLEKLHPWKVNSCEKTFAKWENGECQCYCDVYGTFLPTFFVTDYTLILLILCNVLNQTEKDLLILQQRGEGIKRGEEL